MEFKRRRFHNAQIGSKLLDLIKFQQGVYSLADDRRSLVGLRQCLYFLSIQKEEIGYASGKDICNECIPVLGQFFTRLRTFPHDQLLPNLIAVATPPTTLNAERNTVRYGLNDKSEIDARAS